MIILNIGLNVVYSDKSRGTNAPLDVLYAVAQRLPRRTVTNFRVVQSNSEPTVVVECNFQARDEELNNWLTYLCNLLNQDAIAWYATESNEGGLVGPRAAEWGTFNPEFFFLVTGNTLAQESTNGATRH